MYHQTQGNYCTVKKDAEYIGGRGEGMAKGKVWPEPVFLNVYGAQESISRHQFRQPM
jgi:hypothetical protein